MPSASRRLSKNSRERLPEFSARLVDEEDGDHVALAGLQEREDFEPFVERAEAAGEESDGIAFFDEHQLAREKYFMCTSLGSPAMIGLDDCSKGSMMLRPIEFSRPAPRWPASMMPLAAPVTTSQPMSAMARPNLTACW